MEMGAGTRLIAVLLLVQCTAGLTAGSWRTGVFSLESTSLVSQEGRLLSEQYSRMILDVLTAAEYRELSAPLQSYAASRAQHQEFIDAARSHHQMTNRQNDNFFRDRAVERAAFPKISEAGKLPDRLELSLRTFNDTISFGDLSRMYFTSIDYRLDEIIGSSLVREGRGYRLHIFHYLSHEQQTETLLFIYLEPGSLPDKQTLKDALFFFSSPEPERARIPALPAADETPPMIRTIPSGASVSGASGLYGISLNGYSSQYLFDPKIEGITELRMTPQWELKINSVSRRSDQFYRSLASLMLSVPITFLAHDAASQSTAGQMVFLSAASVNVALTVKTLIDLFRYTNYLQ